MSAEYQRGYMAGQRARDSSRHELPWVRAAATAQAAIKCAIDRHGTSEELREAHDAVTALFVARSGDEPQADVPDRNHPARVAQVAGRKVASDEERS
jgi:hypothetical protein